MGRLRSAPLALIVFTLTCSLSVYNVSSIRPQLSLYSLVPASMRLRDIRLLAGHCCNRFCDCAEVDNAMAEHCRAIEERVSALPPSLCASDSHNSSSGVLCPPSRAAILCNGGPSCCSESCNEPCTSNLDVCACPCNHCSICSCCKQVRNSRCKLKCRPCKKVWMMLDFQDQHGKPHSVNFSQDFILDSAKPSMDAEFFYAAHWGKSSILGFFNPNDPNIVHVDKIVPFLNSAEDYPVKSSWVEFGAYAAFPVFTVVVILTGLLIALLLQKMRRADQRRFRIAWSVNRGLWMGIIWPLIILLLILQVRNPVPMRETALSILLPQILACIGWLPLLLLWLYHIIHPQL